MKLKFRHLALPTLTIFVAAACFDVKSRDRQKAETQALEPAQRIENSPLLPHGSYGVQSAAYDDASGSYKIFLLGAPPEYKALFQHTDVKMARITDEEL